MTNRITDSMLEARVRRLNELTGSPLSPYSTIDGRAVANIGNFHLSYAYGGVCLHRMANESGGIRTPGCRWWKYEWRRGHSKLCTVNFCTLEKKESGNGTDEVG